MAYFLISGQLPFDRDTPLQMLHAHAYEPLALLPEFQEDVPADLQRVIIRCLEISTNSAVVQIDGRTGTEVLLLPEK